MHHSSYYDYTGHTNLITLNCVAVAISVRLGVDLGNISSMSTCIIYYLSVSFATLLQIDTMDVL